MAHVSFVFGLELLHSLLVLLTLLILFLLQNRISVDRLKHDREVNTYADLFLFKTITLKLFADS